MAWRNIWRNKRRTLITVASIMFALFFAIIMRGFGKGSYAKMKQNAIEAYSDDDGWAQLGPVGSNVAKQAPEFDPRNYGYRKLKDLVKAMRLFELREESEGSRRTKVIYIRIKRRK